MTEEMSPEELKLHNALRYYRHDGSVSTIKELALGKVGTLTLRRTLLPALKMNALPFQSVVMLDLSRNRLGPHAFSCLMHAVAGTAPNLKELDVSWNMATAECCPAIAMMLANNAVLQKLVISNNPLTTCISEDLGKAMKTNRTLKSLELEAVGLMDACSLFEGISGHPGLTSLNVSRNGCGSKSWLKFGQSVTQGIPLKSLRAKNAEIGREAASSVAAAIRSQKVMTDLDVSGCKLGASEAGELVEALSACAGVKSIVLADNKLQGGDLGRSLAALCNKAELDWVDLSNCELSDDSAKSIMASLSGGKRIAAFSLANNDLSDACGAVLKTCLLKMWKNEKRPNRVVFSGNNVEKLFYADVMADDYDDAEGEGAWLPDELEIADTKATPEVLESIAQLYENGDGACSLKRIRLDGLCLGKPPGQGRLPRGAPVPPPIIATLLGVSAVRNELLSVTLHNAQLKDAGASYLAQCMKGGWRVSNLDLGMNEIGDTGSSDLADSITVPSNQLSRLQLRLNRIRNDGAVALAKCVGNENCKLKTLVLNSNIIGTGGLKALMQAINASATLELLDCENQKEAIWKEDDFAVGAAQLATALSKRPLDLPSLSIDLSKIEGMGMASAAIDCASIQTDYSANHKISTLGLQDCLDIMSMMKSSLSTKDLEAMFGGFGTAPGQSPSWLASADMRSRAVYVAHLQLSITKDRLTDWFESEADADVQELYLCVDKGLKTPNGFAWVLFKDSSSVEKSSKLYNEGRATIYGSPFIVSTIDVTAEESEAGAGNIEAELADRAAAEAARRMQERSDIDAAHAKSLEKQKNQKAAYGGSDMGMSHSNTLGGQNCVKTLDDGKPW
jgi:Ran GTPase-activating protein (RanGAP) involved in mRNA processing and transport